MKKGIFVFLAFFVLLAPWAQSEETEFPEAGKTFWAKGIYREFRDAAVRPDGSTFVWIFFKKLRDPLSANPQPELNGSSIAIMDAGGNVVSGQDYPSIADKIGNKMSVDAMAGAANGSVAMATSIGSDIAAFGVGITVFKADNSVAGVYEKRAQPGDVARKVVDMTATADGGFAAVGYYVGKDNMKKTFLIKIDGSGKGLLHTDIDGPASLEAVSGAPDGGYLIAGRMDDANKGDLYVAALAADGSVKLSKRYSSFTDQQIKITDIRPAPGGGFELSGITIRDDDKRDNPSFAWKITLDSKGEKIGEGSLPTEKDEVASAMAAVPSGGFILVSLHWKDNFTRESVVRKLDDNFKSVWTKKIVPPAAIDMSRIGAIIKVNVSPQGDYTLCGFAASETSSLLGDAQSWIARLDAEGNSLW